MCDDAIVTVSKVHDLFYVCHCAKNTAAHSHDHMRYLESFQNYEESIHADVAAQLMDGSSGFDMCACICTAIH